MTSANSLTQERLSENHRPDAGKDYEREWTMTQNAEQLLATDPKRPVRGRLTEGTEQPTGGDPGLPGPLRRGLGRQSSTDRTTAQPGGAL